MSLCRKWKWQFDNDLEEARKKGFTGRNPKRFSQARAIFKKIKNKVVTLKEGQHLLKQIPKYIREET